MQTVESGTTTERIIRALLLAAMLNGFAAAFLWDGYVGYPRKNARSVAVSLGIQADGIPRIDPYLTAARARKIIADVGTGESVEKVLALLGEPALKDKNDLCYVGSSGYLRFKVEGEHVSGARWKGGPYSEADLRWQRIIGYLLGLAGLGALVHLALVVTTRVSLTAVGLKVRGKPVIPYEAMTAIRAGESSQGRSDSLEVEYAVGGQTGIVRLDGYEVKNLGMVAATLRERAGFPLSRPSEQPDAKQSAEPARDDGPVN